MTQKKNQQDEQLRQEALKLEAEMTAFLSQHQVRWIPLPVAMLLLLLACSGHRGPLNSVL